MKSESSPRDVPKKPKQGFLFRVRIGLALGVIGARELKRVKGIGQPFCWFLADPREDPQEEVHPIWYPLILGPTK